MEHKKSRNITIDFLKFLYALEVLLFHGRKLGSSDDWILFPGGWMAVEFFFIVSGYLMMKAAYRPATKLSLGEETARYILNKVKGMFPAILFGFFPALAVAILLRQLKGNPVTVGEAITSVWEPLFLRMSGIQGLSVNIITWYISAMLIAMLPLYPLARRYRQNFSMIIAPLISISFFGYLSQTTGSLATPEKWLGLVYKGLVRAAAGLSVGCICYEITESIRRIPFTKLSKILFNSIMWSFVAGSLAMMQVSSPPTGFSFLSVPVFAVIVVLGFSDLRVSEKGPSEKTVQICGWLGAYSLPVYLNHQHVRLLFTYLKLPYSYPIKLGLFTAASCILALIGMYTVKVLQSFFTKHNGRGLLYE